MKILGWALLFGAAYTYFKAKQNNVPFTSQLNSNLSVVPVVGPSINGILSAGGASGAPDMSTLAPAKAAPTAPSPIASAVERARSSLYGLIYPSESSAPVLSGSPTPAQPVTVVPIPQPVGSVEKAPTGAAVLPWSDSAMPGTPDAAKQVLGTEYILKGEVAVA